MTITLGVSLRINETKLTKRDNGDLLSQQNLVLAHETLARNSYNWVVAYYSKYIELRNENVNSRLLAYCNADDVRLTAFNAAAIWVAKQKKTSGFVFPSGEKLYKKAPSEAAILKAKNDKEKRAILVGQVAITVDEALTYYEFRKTIYSAFDADFGRPFDLFHEGTLESVLSQINRSAKNKNVWFDGKTLYNRYSDKFVEPKEVGKEGYWVRSAALPAWAIEFLIEQEKTHPTAKYVDDRLQVPLYLDNSDIPVFYPAHRRVMVQEVKNAAKAVNKHSSRFFEGGNPKQGLPKFRKYNDDQTFEFVTPPKASLFNYETPNFAKHLIGSIAQYELQESKKPTLSLQREWKKAYLKEWHENHPVPSLNSVTVLNLPELGKVTVTSQGVRKLHELLHFTVFNKETGEVEASGGKLLLNTRLSRKGGKLSVSFSIKMPESWLKARPDSYHNADTKKVGVDAGIIDSAILSTGYSFSNISRNTRHESHHSTEPRTVQERAFKKAMTHEKSGYEKLRLLEEKVATLQQKASNIYDVKLKENDGQHKGLRSLLPQSWHTLQAQIKRTQNQITNIREHHRNVVAKTIVSNFDFVGIEDLNIAGLISKNHTKTDDLGNYLPNGQSAKRGMNKAMSAVGLGELLLLIRQKAVYYGTEVQIVNRWYASSLLCSACGEKKDKKDLSLSHREYNCEHCGLTIGRDHNAAINILKAAELLEQGGELADEDIISFEEEVKELEKAAKAQKQTEN